MLYGSDKIKIKIDENLHFETIIISYCTQCCFHSAGTESNSLTNVILSNFWFDLKAHLITWQTHKEMWLNKHTL